MAFEGTGLLSHGNSNYFSFQPRKPNEGKLPQNSELILTSNHTYIVDSRQRDTIAHPSPSSYSIDFGTPYKNVTSIELKAAMLPKCQYNVHSGNNRIDFNLDDTVTNVILVDGGNGYLPPTGIAGLGIPFPITAVSPPAAGDISAESATLMITIGRIPSPNVPLSFNITTITINTPGAGYIRGHIREYANSSGAHFIDSIIPRAKRSDGFTGVYRRAKVTLEVGKEVTAYIPVGQYDFNHGNAVANSGLPWAVRQALVDATNKAYPGAPWGGLNPFDGASAVKLTTQPWNEGVGGSTPLNRVEIRLINFSNIGSQITVGPLTLFTPTLELLWGSGSNHKNSAIHLLGYGSTLIQEEFGTITNQSEGSRNLSLDQANITNSTTSGPAALPSSFSNAVGLPFALTDNAIFLRSRNDYNLYDYPDYTIITFTSVADSDRIESGDSTLDEGFAVLIFDNNPPNVLWRRPDANATAAGTQSQWGNTTEWIKDPGTLKALRGDDFTKKILQIYPPLAKCSSLHVSFKKFGGELMDFKGRDHLLIFEIGCNDINTGNRF